VNVVYFGTYDRGYPRNAQVVSCLRRAGVEVDERHVPVWDGVRDGWQAGGRDVARLALAELRLLSRRPARHDALIVGYPGHPDLLAARRAARGAPVVFNPLVSLSDTFVSDRGRYRSGSVAARLLAATDRWALGAADLVVADTEAHAEFLAGLAGIERSRVAVCMVGAEERIFTPGWDPDPQFRALFVGKLIPLHGLSTILAAARMVPGIRFRVVGSGQLQPLLDTAPPNVEHLAWVDYERLPGELHRAGCALGVFGLSAKAARVIPNKAFQALACGTPLVTADTPAARELLRDGESALLVPPGDAAALAGAVSRLARDPALARQVADSGRRAYQETAGEEVLGRRWRGLLEAVVAGAARPA
jgi:glycosyltransferase involved in cell wall biosynthesis